ncbi:MAG TPA: hypothetical protein VLG38_01500 [Gammaproteobacteria bacterium]|nr:hypothetical protein [Gammaproteobacteria bacterium]
MTAEELEQLLQKLHAIFHLFDGYEKMQNTRQVQMVNGKYMPLSLFAMSLQSNNYPMWGSVSEAEKKALRLSYVELILDLVTNPAQITAYIEDPNFEIRNLDPKFKIHNPYLQDLFASIETYTRSLRMLCEEYNVPFDKKNLLIVEFKLLEAFKQQYIELLRNAPVLRTTAPSANSTAPSSQRIEPDAKRTKTYGPLELPPIHRSTSEELHEALRKSQEEDLEELRKLEESLDANENSAAQAAPIQFNPETVRANIRQIEMQQQVLAQLITAHSALVNKHTMPDRNSNPSDSSSNTPVSDSTTDSSNKRSGDTSDPNNKRQRM